MTRSLTILLLLGTACDDEEPECPNLEGEPCSALLLPEMNDALGCNACREGYVCVERQVDTGTTEFVLDGPYRQCYNDTFGIKWLDFEPDTGWP